MIRTQTRRQKLGVFAASAAAVLLCGCQQIDSIDSQMGDLADFPQLPLYEKNEMIEEWHDMVSLELVKKDDDHCCFIRYQHALKNLAQLVRESDYKKNNKVRYEKIIQDYFEVAKQSTDLQFMTDCMKDKSGSSAEITNIRKAAVSSLVSLNDADLFFTFLKNYSSSDYELPVQYAMADGLIKYLSQFKTDENCAKIIVKSMILKQRAQDVTEMREVEHLIGMCSGLSSLNEAIQLAKNDTAILELVLELNLNFWRKIQKDNLDFSEKSALENIALLKALALNPASKRIDDLVYFALCEIAPAETLSVLNTKLERDPSFENMKNMLYFYYSLNNSKATNNGKFSRLSNIDNTIKISKVLANKFLQESVTALPNHEQKETYEIYARNLPEQIYVFLISRFLSGKDTVSFYENAINAVLWMKTQKIYPGDKQAELEQTIDKLLFSCRKRADYKEVFGLVFSNKTSYLQQWNEMKRAVAKADIVQKDAFVDSYVTLISKIKSGKNIPANFAAANHGVFEYIIASLDTPALLKLVPYLEKNKDQKFLLEKYYISAFGKSKYNFSVAHLSVAGDIAARYLNDLKNNPKLYNAYKKLFFSGISNKNDDVSLLCADYYFRISDPNDKKAIENARKDFFGRWPNLRPVAQIKQTKNN